MDYKEKVIALLNDKELSSEQKEKLESIFPELKESEDERIRKELIDAINGLWVNDALPLPLSVGRKDKWIAWLEKQGEQETLCDKCRKAQPSHSCQDITALGRCYIEGVNTSNNVEPKFHEGDWVVLNNDICQIVKREEGCNKLVTVFGIEKELVNERNLSTARLWTIDDAKDGDVLVSQYNKLFIYNGNYNDKLVGAHCGLNFDGEFKLACLNCNWTDNKNIHPASKEQCDLLFQKIKEAGYEWDAKKKEFKLLISNGGDFESNNSKQKPTWSDEDENGFGDALWAINKARTIAKDENDMGNLWYAENWLKSLKTRLS